VVSVRTKTATQADKMLNAAARLFAAQRYHEVRMEDIAAEAAVGKGTLYRYFSDKEELYRALLDRASRQAVERIDAAVGGAVGPRRRLQALAAALVGFFDEQPHVLELIQRAEAFRGQGGEFPWQSAREAMCRRVFDLFEEGRRSGEFQVCDPEHAMLMLLGGLRAVIRFGPRPRPDDLAERLVNAFLEGAAVGAAGRRNGKNGSVLETV
jgi:TetR/AcrR family transcriptional regulator, cholesterol catabolism regulator